ncbi:MAG: recombinase family protein, partial [Chloroflexota bacterium]
RGRLYAAKERMLLKGMWMGGNINLGYMVDNRKTLPSGIANPNWRKFAPFKPCADVVNKIFETFIMLDGNQRATLRYLHENGPHFPDFDDPELLKEVPPGYSWAKPMRMKKRDGIYMVGAVSLQNMLTNAVYQGHWVFKDCVVQWNNHPAIVPEDLFFKAFNYLSPVNFDGTTNEDYRPRLGRRYSTKKQHRNVDEPIYIGLVGSYHKDEWRGATASWTKGMKAYAYTVNYLDSADNQHHLWSRRGDYFDRIINEMLFAKLRALEHFLNACCSIYESLSLLEICLAESRRRFGFPFSIHLSKADRSMTQVLPTFWAARLPVSIARRIVS